MDLESAQLIRRTLQGDRVALARAISWVENEAPAAKELLDAFFERSEHNCFCGLCVSVVTHRRYDR